MQKYLIKLKSTTPILFNTRQRDIELELKEVKKNELEEWESKNWHRKAELDEKGNVILPIRWFRKTFIEACKHSKLVPNFATRKSETYTRYAGSMIFRDSTFKGKSSQFKQFGSYVGATGLNSSTKVWRIRPKLDEWETTIELIDPVGRMTEKEIKEIFEYAGLIEGIGDGRSLNFGRFQVVSIKKSK